MYLVFTRMSGELPQLSCLYDVFGVPLCIIVAESTSSEEFSVCLLFLFLCFAE